MYGTLARFRIKPGVKDEFIKTMDGFGGAFIPGWIADYYFQMEMILMNFIWWRSSKTKRRIRQMQIVLNSMNVIWSSVLF